MMYSIIFLMSCLDLAGGSWYSYTFQCPNAYTSFVKRRCPHKQY